MPDGGGDEQETYAFSADISQLMSLIINAFYSNKEIFLRELISNASDALDKIRYKASQDPEALASNPELGIKISVDAATKAIIVEDSGIGMTREELVANLGTIAKSGTKAFMEAVSAGCDMSMIGQFGVGFYSAYLVSERIRVISKSNGDPDQNVWESAAGGTFQVWKDELLEHGRLARGTKIICYLKDDQHEFLDTGVLRDLILKHSAFVGFPIELYAEHRREEETPGSEEKTVIITHKWEIVNKNKPVWLRPASEVSHEEYADLYKWLAGDWQDHLGVKHVIYSGQVEYKALLYCPRSAPKDMFDMGKMAARFSIRLYVRRVFIKEFNDLIPKWMGFVKGIVDSDDMPLNIGRERLQQNAILNHIKVGLQKSIFQLFQDLALDKKTYKVFYENFSQCLKLGVYEDHANRPQIIPLLRYQSTKSGDELVSFQEYVDRMKPGQQHILYITGRSYRDAAKSPYIEGLKKEGFEVLFMIDPVDEYAVQFLKEFQGKDLLCCTSSHVGYLVNAGRTKEDLKAELEPLRRRVAGLLAKSVARVTFSDDLKPESCGRLVAEGGSMVMELNPKHSLVRELSTRGQQADDDLMAKALYEIASVDETHPDDVARARVIEFLQDLVQRLSMGEQESCGDELPVAEADVVAIDLDLSKKVAPEGSPLSCGSAVRVCRENRSRRAIVSFVDEDAKTVDVLYPKWGGGEDEEEGVPASKIQRLMPFESDATALAAVQFQISLYKTSTLAKEQGNELFKIKDFEAAHERYSAIIRAFCSKPPSRGQQVLVPTAMNGCRTMELKAISVTSVDADGNIELSDGREIPASTAVPVFSELLPLQTAAYMNRARCRQSLGMFVEAARDLSVVLALWAAADRRMMDADPEMKEAAIKGQYTALYLRAKARLSRGYARQAAADVKAGLQQEPPAPMAKQLKQLKVEVQAAQEEHRRVHGPLAKELAKALINIRGGPTIS